MERDDISLGNELTAAVMVLNPPDVVVPTRTIRAPVGGEVREAARAVWYAERRNPTISPFNANICVGVVSFEECSEAL